MARQRVPQKASSMAHLLNSLGARDIASHSYPYNNLKTGRETGPTVVTGGNGVEVYDEDGKVYIEAPAGLWCTVLGFYNERLVKAESDATAELAFYHGFGVKRHPAAIGLAEKLLEVAPVPMSKVFCANSDSETNDMAIKIIWYVNNALGRPEKKENHSPAKSLSWDHYCNNDNDGLAQKPYRF